MQQILLTIVAEVTATGVKVTGVKGPIDDKMLSYGMLESAKDLIREFKPSAVQIPDGETTRQLVGV